MMASTRKIVQRLHPNRRCAKLYFFLPLPLLFAFFLSCKTQPMEPAEMQALYSRWYVNPTEVRLDSLLDQIGSCQGLESLLSLISGNPDRQVGKQSVVLSDSAGALFTLGYSTPTSIRSDTTYPLIIYLHGGTGTAITNKGENAYEMLTPLADTFQLFLASPSANRNALWWSPAGLGRILQTVRYMTLHYPIDRNRIFLAGVSDGATGCWAAANTICAPFAGFFAISGYGGLLQQSGIPLYPGNIMQRPIYSVNAGKDHLYPLNIVNRFLDTMSSRGVNVIRKAYPQENHGFDYRAKEYGALAGFLRTWSKPESNGGFVWTMVPGFPNAPENLLEMLPSVRPIGSPFASGFWKNDTVIIQTEGTGRITLMHGVHGGPTPYAQINGGAVTRMQTVSDNRRLLLTSLVRGGTLLRCPATFTIVVPGEKE